MEIQNITHKLKKINAAVKPYNNEKGFIMGAVMLLSLMLLIIVTMAIWSSSNESMVVRNTGIMTQEFYDAESGIVGAMNHSLVWLTDSFLNPVDPDTAYVRLNVYSNGDVTVAGGNVDGAAIPASGTPPAGETLVAQVQIRHLNTYVTSPTFLGPPSYPDVWPEANLYPNMAGTGPPSGDDSAVEFEARRFVLTAKDAANQNAVVQVGFSRTVPKAEL